MDHSCLQIIQFFNQLFIFFLLQAYLSSTLMSCPTPRVFSEIAFKHPLFGLRAPISNTKVEVGCDACNWFFTIWSGTRHPVRFFANDRRREGTGDTRYAFEFTCSYNQYDRRRAKMCKAHVEDIRSHLNSRHLKFGTTHHHYYNTPSCHPKARHERPFFERYFGESYGHLLRIKEEWDPHNVFNHCHSIGSNEEDCCYL